MAIAITLLVVLLVAVLVLVGVAALLVDDEGQRPAAALRAGFARWRARRRAERGAERSPEDGAAAPAAVVAPVLVDEPVDVSLAELLRATTERGEGYVRVDELAAGLQRVTQRTSALSSELVQHVRKG